MNSFKELLPVECLQNLPVQSIVVRTILDTVCVESAGPEVVLGYLSTHSWQITIPPHTHIREPIDISHLISYGQKQVAEKLVITIGEHSCVVFNDEMLSIFSHIKELTIIIKPYAQVKWYGNYVTQLNSFHGIYCTVMVQEHAVFNGNILVHSKGATECKVALEFFGVHALAQVQIGSMSKDNAHCFIETVQNHGAQSTQSAIMVKQLAHDKSHMHYKGAVEVLAAAQHTIASQKHHALILSKMARVFANPQLNVHHNKEVQCMHGSAISHLNTIALWYLMSRGIAQDDACEMLVEGFFSDMDIFIKRNAGNERNQ